MANFISSITLQFKDAFTSGFKGAQESFVGMKGALDDLNKNKSMIELARDISATAALTDPFRQKLSAMIDEPSRLAGQFETAFSNIALATGASGKELSALRSELISIGGKAIAGPQKVAEAFAAVASGVEDASKHMAVMNAAVSLSEANQTDLSVAAGAMVNVMNAWNISGDNAAIAADVLTQSVKMGVGSFEDFSGSLGHISTIAAQAGIGLDELGATMAYATNKGMSASQSSKQLKSVIGTLLSPGEGLAKIYKGLGIESGSAMLKQYGLAESLHILKSAVGGSEDAFSALIGNQEAAAVAAALTEDKYLDFAGSFSDGMGTVTEAARKVQTQSYEAKVARLKSATDAMKTQIGGDVNAIKGFFVDMGTGFLAHVAAPIMSSPVGGVFQGLAAGVGVVGKGILDLGGNALNTASQLVTLTATLQNAGGFVKLFGSSLSLLGQPLKIIPSLLFKGIPAFVSFGAAAWAAMAPLLPIIIPIVAVVGALSLAGVLLYKNWEKVKAFFVGVFTKLQGLLSSLSNKFLAVVAAVFPIIGIPALIIKNWETIKAFFVGLWVRVSSTLTAFGEVCKNFFAGLGEKITEKCRAAWEGIKTFFIGFWNGIVSIVTSVANWLSGVWQTVTGAFASAWNFVKDIFASVWESIKGVVMGFVEWLSPVIDMILAPFKAVANVIGGIVGSVKSWFGETVDMGKSELAKMSESATKTITVQPAETSATTTGLASPIKAPSLSTTSAVSSGALGGAVSGGANALAAEHMAAASRKGITGTVNTAASDAFMGAGRSASPSFDVASFNQEAQTTFAQAARPAQSVSIQTPWTAPEVKPEKKERPHFTIQNLTLQCDDIKSVVDFYEMLEMACAKPEAV